MEKIEKLNELAQFISKNLASKPELFDFLAEEIAGSSKKGWIDKAEGRGVSVKEWFYVLDKVIESEEYKKLPESKKGMLAKRFLHEITKRLLGEIETEGIEERAKEKLKEMY